jgi:hypothetical protein
MKTFRLLTFITFVISSYSIAAQNVDYTAWVYQFTSWEGGVFGNCWENGTEEYTRNGYLRDDISATETNVTCQQCNNNGNCTSTGTWATLTKTNVAVTQVRARITAWEDDGTRCSYNGGDDCYTTGSSWTTLTPLEYQNTQNNWNAGDGDHRVYARCNYQYSTTTIEAGVDNSTYSFSTGGTRPFWGSLGSWSNSGGDCATSGTITHNQTSSFSTTVNCVSSISFQWRVSSEANWDYLRFYINGVQQSAISGNTAWATVTYALNPGQSNTLEWRYTKDGSVSSNEDRGFVDAVSYTNYTTALNGGTIASSQTICKGTSPSTLTSTVNASGAGTISYQWQVSNNNSAWSNIGGATGTTYSPPAQTTIKYYRRRGIDHCAYVGYSNTVTIDIHPDLAPGTIASNQSVCSGNIPALLTSTVNASGGNGSNYQWQISLNNSTWTNIGLATSATYQPLSQAVTTYYRRRATSNCGETLYSNTITISITTSSTAPSIAPVAGVLCPNTSVTLNASGGTAGSGSAIEWYTGPSGTGTHLGTGSSFSVSPSASTTYYVRREGTCNTTTDGTTTVSVKPFIYAATGSTTSTNYCTDNAGWHHFYDGNDIIFSLQGDLSGAAIGYPEVTVTNAGAFNQQRELGGVIDCINGVSNGEERFEMRRNWNVDFGGGTYSGTYKVRYYFPATEKTEIVAAAAAFSAANPSCNYSFKYANPDGFYWFKTAGSNYSVAYDGLHLTAAGNSINSVNYSEISGISSFSGGSGAIILIPDPSLSPLAVEFVSFEGWANGKVNQLAWQTASLINSERFEVERMTSLDQDFIKIGEVASPVNSTNLMTFNFTDEKPIEGVSYYRVNEIDFDGTVTTTKVVAVTQNSGSDYQLYPNPTNDIITYSFSSDVNEEREITIMDLSGRIVESRIVNSVTGNNTINFNLNELAKGAYIFKVNNSQGVTIISERVVVH